MKNIKSFKLFEKIEKSIKVEDFLMKKLVKSKSIGSVKDYHFDFNKMILTVTFHDNSVIVKKLKIHNFLVRDFSKDQMRIKKVPIYTFEETRDGGMDRFHKENTYTVGSQADEKFWDNFNAIEKAFIKSNRTKTVNHQNKEYSLNDFYNTLLPSLEIYQKIMSFGYKDITSHIEKKNGTIQITKWDKEEAYGYPYKITKNGKIYKMSSQSITLQSYSPLINLSDYEKCLNFLYDNVFKKEIDKEIAEWKLKYEENPNEVLKMAGEMPLYVSKIILPEKIHNLKKTGLLDN